MSDKIRDKQAFFCKGCGVVKDACEFHSYGISKDKLHNYCKLCQCEQARNRYKISRQSPEWMAERNRKSILKYEELKKNPEWVKMRTKRECARIQRNRDVLLARQRASYRRHAKERIIQKAIYTKNKKETDPLFRLLFNERARISAIFKKLSLHKNIRTKTLLGLDEATLKKYIERQFTEGMSWDNYGKWHIDHKYPLSKAKNKEELIELCHYTNLQPLWESDNLSKGSKIIEHQRKIAI